MATVISGILNQRLPWRLWFLGVFLVIAIELLGIRSLPFAVGSYLSIATTMTMFAGGLVRWLAERGVEKTSDSESEVSPGSLYASGLIAAGGIFTTEDAFATIRNGASLVQLYTALVYRGPGLVRPISV